MHHTEPMRTLGDHTWHEQAACRPTQHHPVDLDLFFPEHDEMDRIRAAKALCAQCPVRNTCLDAALENSDRDGIRGGMTEEERDPLHRKLHRRLSYDRVNAVLAGRDVHLTQDERDMVLRAAYQNEMPAERLAWLLKITEEHAEKLYRRTRLEISHRALDQEKKPKKKAKKRTKKPGNATKALKDPAASTPSRDDLGTAA